MKAATKYLAAIAAIAAAATASAVPTLTLSDGVNADLVITDGGAGDSNPAVGAVTYNGSYNLWTINVDTGLTKPVLGSMTAPHLDLAYQAVSSGAANLVITFSDDGFVYTGGLKDHFGGTVNSMTGASTDLSTAVNRVLVNGQAITSLDQGPYGPGAFSGTTLGQVALAAGDTLAIQVGIHHAAAGNSSGDKDVIAVPEGGMTLVLLGSGLSALAFLRRKMQS